MLRVSDNEFLAVSGAGGALMRGVVKWFDAHRGYGFIVPEEGGQDVFLHRRVLQASTGRRRVDPGVPVDYEIQETPQGRKVTRIVLIEAGER